MGRKGFGNILILASFVYKISINFSTSARILFAKGRNREEESAKTRFTIHFDIVNGDIV